LHACGIGWNKGVAVLIEHFSSALGNELQRVGAPLEAAIARGIRREEAGVGVLVTRLRVEDRDGQELLAPRYIILHQARAAAGIFKHRFVQSSDFLR
jgi:hypothetical protein